MRTSKISLHGPAFLTMIALLTLLASTARGEIIITAVGDIMLAGSGTATYSGKGYAYPFAATSEILRNSDLTIGNLEAPLSDRGVEWTGKRFRFRASPEAARALKDAGFSVVSLANNHIFDYGPSALDETLSNLDRQGILHTGAGKNLTEARREAIATVKGKKVAFLSYSLTLPAEFFAGRNRPGTAPGYLSFVEADIRRIRPLADYVVVSFHWGREMATRPNPTQVTTAHRAVDAGADLVLGHHPHVLQGAEKYRNGVILYSLGNFAFGSLGTGTADSAIARITLGQGVEEVELIPLNVQNYQVRFQPQPLKGARRKAVTDHFTRISRQWRTVVVEREGRALLAFVP